TSSTSPRSPPLPCGRRRQAVPRSSFRVPRANGTAPVSPPPNPSPPWPGRSSEAVRPFLRILLGLLLLPALGAVAGCTEEPPADPKALLATAKRRLDAASTVRFELTGTRLPDTGGYLVSGSGTAKRPASFEGRFRIAVGGVAATVEVVSVNGTLYAQLPFQDDFVRTDPDTLGIRDPAELLSPKGGLSSLLSEARGLKSHGRSRK